MELSKTTTATRSTALYAGQPGSVGTGRYIRCSHPVFVAIVQHLCLTFQKLGKYLKKNIIGKRCLFGFGTTPEFGKLLWALHRRLSVSFAA